MIAVLPSRSALAAWPFEIPDTTVALGLQLRENFDVGLQPSVLQARLPLNDSNPGELRSRYCPTFESEACIQSEYVYLSHNWDVCNSKLVLDCIVGVWAVDPSGKRIDGQYLKSAPANVKYDYEESVPMNRPSSRGMGGIWKFPGVLNGAGKDTYFVSVQSQLNMNKAAKVPMSQAKFDGNNNRAAIFGVEEYPGNFEPPYPVDGGRGGMDRLSDGTLCIAADTNVCNKVVAMPEDYRFGLSIRFAKPVNGWFHGRFFQPNVEISQSKNGQIVSIEAAPVRVSSLDFIVPKNEIVEPVKKLIFNGKGWGHSGGPDSGIRITEDLSNSKTFDLIRLFAPMYKDKATQTESSWSFKTLTENGDSPVSRCTASSTSLAGLVTTNALSYSAGAPTFNRSTGTLEYQVASPHLEANGQIALGTYDLALRSDIARCIYNFSNAPIKAEVSITGDDGEKRVATTVVNEKDGWLYMSAKGFTFSAPKIQVKISQEAPAKVEEVKTTTEVVKTTAAVTPKVVVAKKSITCVKGKITKKITGSSPKCPTGFKRK